mgnify:FL=1
MVTNEQRKRINDSTSTIIEGTLKGLMIRSLNHRIAYWRFKRMHSRKNTRAWRKCNEGISYTLREIERVLSPDWCKE